MLLTRQQVIILLRSFDCRGDGEGIQFVREDGDKLVVYDLFSQQEVWLLEAELHLEPDMDARITARYSHDPVPFGWTPTEDDDETTVTVYPRIKPALKGDILRQLERY